MGIIWLLGEIITMYICLVQSVTHNWPLTRYEKLRVAHASGMPGTVSPPQWVSDPDMHHGTYVTHVQWCMPGSLTNGFLWSRWRRKRSRHSRCMRNPQFYVSGKWPIVAHVQQGDFRKILLYPFVFRDDASDSSQQFCTITVVVKMAINV